MEKLPIHLYLLLPKKYRDTRHFSLNLYPTNRSMNVMKYSVERVSRTSTS